MTRRRLRRWAAVGLLAAGCASPYGERRPAAEPPPRETPPETRPPEARPPDAIEPPARPPDAGEGTAVVGTIGPDGSVRADTLPGAPPDTTRVERETVVTGAVRRAPDDARLVVGWRVQVYAARDRAQAADVARRLEDAVGDLPIYVERADPWFKVRVGDFETADRAAAARDRLVELGYPEAWTVRTTIRTSP